jgi:hypothetical protein
VDPETPKFLDFILFVCLLLLICIIVLSFMLTVICEEKQVCIYDHQDKARLLYSTWPIRA